MVSLVTHPKGLGEGKVMVSLGWPLHPDGHRGMVLVLVFGTCPMDRG